MALTRRQREVLDVIREFIEANGYSPSLEEIGGTLGLTSVATVHKHITHLVEKGFVRRVWNQNRSIELADDREGNALDLPLRRHDRRGESAGGAAHDRDDHGPRGHGRRKGAHVRPEDPR